MNAPSFVTIKLSISVHKDEAYPYNYKEIGHKEFQATVPVSAITAFDFNVMNEALLPYAVIDWNVKMSPPMDEEK